MAAGSRRLLPQLATLTPQLHHPPPPCSSALYSASATIESGSGATPGTISDFTSGTVPSSAIVPIYAQLPGSAPTSGPSLRAAGGGVSLDGTPGVSPLTSGPTIALPRHGGAAAGAGDGGFAMRPAAAPPGEQSQLSSVYVDDDSGPTRGA